MQQTTFVTFLLMTAAFMGVSWSESGLLTAFEGLDDSQKATLNAIGPNFITELVAANECIARELSNVTDICNFNTPISPLYYLEKCLNGTALERIVENFVRQIPVANLSFGVPQKVSNDRCDCDLVPQPSCFFKPPTLPPVTILPTSSIVPTPSIVPPSIFGDKLGGR